MRALVTGASSGIGAAIARRLAAAGAEVVLTARRAKELGEVAAACGPRATTIVADLGVADGWTRVWSAATAAAPIDVVINNAGFGYFRRFDAVEWSRDAEMLQLNVHALVALSRALVDSRKPGAPAAGRRGYLLNIASIGAYQSVPAMALYAATKAFVRNFTEALHDELRGTALSATCVSPGGTHTAFHAQAGAGDYSWIANASMKSADDVARIAIAAMLRGKRNAIPGVLNKLSCFGVRLVPRRFASWMATRVLGKPRHALPARASAG